MIINFSNYPKSLPVLSIVELWERFGFYIVQGLLVLFMTQKLGMDDATAASISGVFLGLIFISSIIGGYLADNHLGYKISILYGALFLIIGYMLLGFASSNDIFRVALATIVIGNGLFKSNISSLVGMQYKTNKLSRDAGFTLFYMGVNAGAILSGLSGYLKDFAGWHITFSTAALGLCVSLLTFISGMKHITFKENRPLKFIQHVIFIFFLCIIILALSSAFNIRSLINWLMIASICCLALTLSVLLIKQKTDQRHRLVSLSILIFSSIIFWALFLQMYISTNLFIDRLVDKQLFGITLNTTIFYASQSVFVILLSPVFIFVWQRIARSNLSISPILKFSLGMVMTGVAFSLLSLSTTFISPDNHINPIWIFSSYIILTIGELLISPIGLAAISQSSPTNTMGIMMGAWFMAIGIGGTLAGIIGKSASLPTEPITQSQMLIIYQNAFLYCAFLAFVASIFLVIAWQINKRNFR